MSATDWAPLIADLELELQAISRVTDESRWLLGRTPDVVDALYVRAGASILQDFYTGAEKIWRRVADEIDGRLPAGSDWHTQLLSRMTVGIEGVRPAVIGADLAERLREYLRFRHLARGIYGFSLDWERIRRLLQPLPELLEALAADVRHFEDFLRAAGAES
ncbi:MAG: ribonuclease toxin HepT-like protein [Anaerolineae bacterium]